MSPRNVRFCNNNNLINSSEQQDAHSGYPRLQKLGPFCRDSRLSQAPCFTHCSRLEDSSSASFANWWDFLLSNFCCLLVHSSSLFPILFENKVTWVVKNERGFVTWSILFRPKIFTCQMYVNEQRSGDVTLLLKKLLLESAADKDWQCWWIVARPPNSCRRIYSVPKVAAILMLKKPRV